MDSRTESGRLRGLSAHAIALAALFVALGSGAYAALGINSVGSQQLRPNSVGSSELDKAAVDTENLKKRAVEEAKLAEEAVTQEKLAAESVGLAQMQKDSVGQDQLKALAVGQAQMQNNSILGAMIDNGTIQPEDLAPSATSTLYTDNNDAGLTITTDTPIAGLALPAGTYLVGAGVQAVHTGTGSATRLECYIVNGAEIVDFAKERLEPNTGAAPLIFTKQVLQGPATLASEGALTYRCTTTGPASTIDLTNVHFSALRVANIVAQ